MSAEGDLLNPAVDDLQEPGRQEQILDLVERLAGFEPNKIALEAEPGSSTVGEQYARFLEGELAVGLDEREQIGFRLARRLGHERVHGVDHYQPVDVQGVLIWANQNGQELLAGWLQVAYAQASSRWNQGFMRDHTMLEIYRAFNSPEVDREIHQIFVSSLAIGNLDEPVGAALLSAWYERNILIAANIVRLAEPGDRIVVLFGANHRKLLIEFLKATRGIEVVETGDLLGRP